MDLFSSDYGVKYTDLTTVPRKPEVLSQTGDTTIIGRTTLVYMVCVARGVPTPTFYWTRTVTGSGTTERVTSNLNSRYTVTSGRLSIQDPIEFEDAGQYQCVIENDIGKILGTPSLLDFAGMFYYDNMPSLYTEMLPMSTTTILPGVVRESSNIWASIIRSQGRYCALIAVLCW